MVFYAAVALEFPKCGAVVKDFTLQNRTNLDKGGGGGVQKFSSRKFPRTSFLIIPLGNIDK